MNTYEEFFESLIRIFEKVDEEKKKGVNDYNLFTALRNTHEEVGLHSRFIASLLDPYGTHYQGSLFLDRFIEAVGIEEFGLKSHQAWICREYKKNIDIYITDGEKHIIIENKVYAIEQERQIARYIEIIRSENKDIPADNIYVLYLSLDKKDPSPYSLGEGEYEIIDKKYICLKDYKMPYKAIGYSDEIKKWIHSSMRDIESKDTELKTNLSNIYQSLQWYGDVINMLNKTYRSVIVDLSEHLKIKENYKVALQVVAEFPRVRKEICQDFFTDEKFEASLREVFPANEWELEVIIWAFEKKWWQPVKIFKKGYKELCFVFEFNRDDYYSGCFGIAKSKESVDLNSIKDKLKKDSGHTISEVKYKNPDWWLVYEWLPSKEADGDFAKEIQLNKFTHEKFKKRIQELKNIWLDLFEEANSKVL